MEFVCESVGSYTWFHLPMIYLSGFVGCIESMKVQGNTLEWGSAYSGGAVTECVFEVCESHQCQNGGTCQPNSLPQGGYRCLCPPGLSGRLIFPTSLAYMTPRDLLYFRDYSKVKCSEKVF